MSYSYWSKEEKQIIRKCYPCESNKVIMRKLPNRSWDGIKKQAGKLKVIERPLYLKKQVNKNFFNKWSNKMAYVLGFFAADGCMYRGKRGYGCITFSQKEPEILQKILTLMNSNAIICSSGVGYDVQIYNNHIFNRLLELGMTPRKSLTLEFPKIPNEYMKHFIRGVFDGDGGISVSKNHNITCGFTCGSEKFIKMLRSFFLLIKIESSLYFTNCWQLYLCKRDTIRLFHYMYSGVLEGMYLQQKYNIFKKIISYWNNSPNRIPWSDKEDLVVIKYYSSKSKKFIMELLPNRSWISIRIRAQCLNVKRPKVEMKYKK